MCDPGIGCDKHMAPTTLIRHVLVPDINDYNVISTAVRVNPNQNQNGQETPVFDAVPEKSTLRNGNLIMDKMAHHVFGTRSDQEDVVQSFEPIFGWFLKGYPIGFLATGPPAGGKSYTIFGPGFDCTSSEANYGVLPRLISYIFANVESLVSVSLSAAEVSYGCATDVLNWNNDNCLVGITNEGLTDMIGFTKKHCVSPREAMSVVQEIMSSRRLSVIQQHQVSHKATLYVSLELIRTGPDKQLNICRAAFVDLESVSSTCVITNPSVAVDTDYFLLNAFLKELMVLPMAPYERTYLASLHTYHFIKDFFSGLRIPCVIGCISAISYHPHRTFALIDLLRAMYLWSNKMTIEAVNNYKQRVLENNIDNLALQKTKYEEISQDASQLERIEEVTESEEDIASSDEKMSESVDSMENLCCELESDQDETEAKTYQSDTDFVENLDSLFVKFKDSVDSFVETFKSKPVMNQKNERNRLCSSARRGGVSNADLQGDTASGGESLNINKDDSISLQSFFLYHKTSKCESSTEPEKAVGAEGASSSFDLPSTLCKSQGQDRAAGQDINYIVDLKDSDKAVTNLIENSILKLRELKRKWLQFEFAHLPNTESNNKLQIPGHGSEADRIKDTEIEIREGLIDVNVATEHMTELLNHYMEPKRILESVNTHRIRKFRKLKDDIDELRTQCSAFNEETLFFQPDPETRTKIMGEEFICAIDSTIEHLNRMDGYRPPRKLPIAFGSKPDNLKKMESHLINFMRNLKIDESQNLSTLMFYKLIESKKTNKSLDQDVVKAEGKIMTKNSRIHELLKQIDGLRREVDRLGKVPNYPCRRAHASTSNALALPSRPSKADKSGAGVAALIPQQNLNKLLPVKSPQSPKSCFIDKDQRKLIFTNKARHPDKKC